MYVITNVSSILCCFYYPSLHSDQIQTIYICHRRSGHKNEAHLTCPLGMIVVVYTVFEIIFLGKESYNCITHLGFLDHSVLS